MSVFRMIGQSAEWSELQNNRDAPRFPVRPVVSLALANGVVVRGHLVDMSVGGALLDTLDRPFGLVPGEEGRLGLLVPADSPEGAYQFPCEVVRVSQKGVALRFIPGEREGVNQEDRIEQLMPDDFLL